MKRVARYLAYTSFNDMVMSACMFLMILGLTAIVVLVILKVSDIVPAITW